MGTIGADPGARISLLAQRGGVWGEVDYTWPDQFGYFSNTAAVVPAAGTPVWAVYEGSGSTYASTSPTVSTTGPRATMSVAKAGYGNQLYVNVNPDVGSAYWNFRVQKRNAALVGIGSALEHAADQRQGVWN